MTASDLTFSRSGDNLIATLSGGADSVTLTSLFGLDVRREVELFSFADGSSLNLAEITALAIASQTTPGDTTIKGSRQNDRMEGGLGNDKLIGGGGGDLYVYRSGDGNDDIQEYSDNGTDVLHLVDLRRDEVRVDRSGFDLIVTDVNTSQTVTVRSFFNTGASTYGYGVEVIRFTDGDEWGRAEIVARIQALEGTMNDDSIAGTSGTDEIYGDGGQDQINAGAGDDQIWGGAGDDLIDGGDGSDTAMFTGSLDDYSMVRNADGSVTVTDARGFDGVDILRSIETVWFQNGAVPQSVAMDALVGEYGTNASDARIEGTVHSDNLYGLAGDDVLVGFAGDDHLDGGEGADQANYAGRSTDFTFTRTADGSITLTDTTGAEGADTLVDMEAAYFHGDQTWLSLSSVVSDYGTEGDDTWLDGTAGKDHIYGLGGDDTLTGRAGDDRLYGGAGTDLANYAGQSIDFKFARAADGSITVTDRTGAEGVDALFDVEAVYFNGDQTWLSLNSLVADYGTEGDDSWLDGTSGQDHIYGLGGDDMLIGRAGDDWLHGGAGFDQANYLGASTDFSFVLNLDGTVTITDLAGDEGVDVLDSVEAVYFGLDQTWLSIDDLFETLAQGGQAFKQEGPQILPGADGGVGHKNFSDDPLVLPGADDFVMQPKDHDTPLILPGSGEPHVRPVSHFDGGGGWGGDWTGGGASGFGPGTELLSVADIYRWLGIDPVSETLMSNCGDWQ